MTKLWLVLLFVCQSAFARELSPSQKASDFNELVGYIQSGYGPLEYKKAEFGIDVETLRDRYMPIMRNSGSNAEFYYAMVRFVAEFNDSHFGVNLPTDLQTYLGFTTDLVQGQLVVDEVDRTLLTLEKFPFQKGDEVVSLNGVPVASILDELQAYMGQGFAKSARRRAAFQVTNRRASKVPAQKGQVVVEFRRGNSSVTEKVELTWLKKGTWLDEFSEKSVAKSAMNYDMIEIEEKFRCSGDTRIKIPTDATVIMKTPFVAYYYPTTKGQVGYLRIPHYSPVESDPSVDAHALRLAQYEYAVNILEKNTVGLIIDQDHNCGGSVEWLHRFLSLFMDRPFAPMQFELLASKASVLQFQSWMNGVNVNTIEYENLVEVRDLILETWNTTASHLTEKTSINGEKERQPNAVRYTKPIIVLIDELSGSGGDAFPAMIKGFGRAKLLGTRTMGAGGHVIELPALGNSQLKVRMTKSLFYRPDDVPVENNGAVPDISYEPTLNDFKFGYQEYQRFYTEELLKML
jgi:hypothetical protein